jgi:hemerythrin-like domain-containing protein
MPDPIAEWHAEHRKFAQLLSLLERELDVFHLGEHPNYELMNDIVSYLHQFADQVHHPREDVAFARLVGRDPDIELLINRLKQEHRVITIAGDELLKYLDEASSDVLIPRAELEAAAATFLVYYRNHLNVEERKIMPLAARHLSKEDWAAVSAAVANRPDPLFGENVDVRFEELRRQIDREAAVSLRG